MQRMCRAFNFILRLENLIIMKNTWHEFFTWKLYKWELLMVVVNFYNFTKQHQLISKYLFVHLKWVP